MNPLLIDLPVPSMGATVQELTLLDLLVKAGERFAKGQKIAEFESDKSIFDFEAPCDGEVRVVFCRIGDILPSGGKFLRVLTDEPSMRHMEVKDAESTAAESAASPISRTTPLHAEKQSPAPETATPKDSPSETAAPPSPRRAARPPLQTAHQDARRPAWTPRALKLAREAGLDPENLIDVPATGPGDRVSGDDIMRYLNSRPSTKAEAGEAAEPAAVARGIYETVRIAGIGYAVPRNVRSNREILKEFPQMTEEEIVRTTGIQQRYYADESESVTSLSKIAVEKALDRAGIDISSIDGIIMATILPDQPVPSAASSLAHALGMNHGLAFDLNAACSGWLYALEIGRALIRCGSAKTLIVVTAELLSRITNPRDHATAFLFGDGAGAAILTADAGGHRLHRVELNGDATHFDAIQRAGGGARMPLPHPGANLDHFYLSMDGAVVFKHAVAAFSQIIEDTIKRHNLTLEDVSWIVPHQANERILSAVAKRIGIPFDRFVMTIGKYGNTSAASVSMALGWAAGEEIFTSGDRIILCSVGAGFTFAGGLLVW